MKINWLLIIVALVFTACSNEQGLNNQDLSSQNENKPLKYSLLSNLFKEILTDTFYVESDNNMENANHKFHGVLMDSLQVSLLPYEIKTNYSNNKDFFACYKFNINETKIGLIARVPSEYVSSALKLFVFDTEKDSITNYLYLAEVFGDAGEISSLSSCIFKDKEKNNFVLSYYYSSYDHSVQGDSTDTIIDESRSYFLFDVTKNITDTLSKDSAKIVHKHPEIIKQLSKE